MPLIGSSHNATHVRGGRGSGGKRPRQVDQDLSACVQACARACDALDARLSALEGTQAATDCACADKVAELDQAVMALRVDLDLHVKALSEDIAKLSAPKPKRKYTKKKTAASKKKEQENAPVSDIEPVSSTVPEPIKSGVST